MACEVTLDIHGDPAVVVADALSVIERVLAELPPKAALQSLNFVRRRCDASEAQILADRFEKGASSRQVEAMAGQDEGTSKAEAKKKARRAKATNANPGLATKLATGTLSTEQADVIAEAAEDTDGEAACDEKLIEEIASTSPEQGKKKAREYINKRKNGDDTQRRYDKQRRGRGVYRHRLPNGNDAITFHGAKEDIDEIERATNAASDIEYQADGGRDVPNMKHPRTRDQRNFDAAHKLITNTPQSTPSQATSSQATTTKSARSKRASKAQRATTVFITTTVDQWSGVDPSPMTGLDGKPLPRSYVEQLAGDASFVAQVFSADGELLWQGREVRLATPAQITGLISRDKGCVECNAHPDKCVAHHLLPWEAPRKGPTNINNLAMVCDDCHIRMHQAKQTMYFCLLYTSPSPRDQRGSRMPSSA